MQSLTHEYLALCRQLGDAQKRCSAALAAQARQIETLQAEVVRLRAQVIVRETRWAIAQDTLAQLAQAHPGLPRRKAMARHISTLAERIASLTRECLRWRLAAQGSLRLQESLTEPVGPEQVADAEAASHRGASNASSAGEGARPAGGGRPGVRVDSSLDAGLAAADLVICQTGCISHDEYWRVQDHCRRTGKPCILVDQPLAHRGADATASIQPMVILRVERPRRAQGEVPEVGSIVVLSKNGL